MLLSLNVQFQMSTSAGLSLSLIWMANWYDVVVCWFPADARTRRATVNDSIASTRFHFNLSTFFSLPQSIGFLNMIYSVEKANLIKLSFTKFQVRRQSEAATQVNKSIILYYFPVFVDSWGEAKKIWWQTKNKTKTNSFPADWPLVLAIFCLAQPVENNNGPPVFLM